MTVGYVVHINFHGVYMCADDRSIIQTRLWILIAVLSTGALLALAVFICIFKSVKVTNLLAI